MEAPLDVQVAQTVPITTVAVAAQVAQTVPTIMEAAVAQVAQTVPITTVVPDVTVALAPQSVQMSAEVKQESLAVLAPPHVDNHVRMLAITPVPWIV